MKKKKVSYMVFIDEGGNNESMEQFDNSEDRDAYLLQSLNAEQLAQLLAKGGKGLFNSAYYTIEED